MPFGDKETESLECGHVFHSDCIQDYLASTGKAKALCCPFKCHQHKNVSFGEPPVVINDDDAEGGGAASSTARAEDSSADAALAVEAHAAATQLFD